VETSVVAAAPIEVVWARVADASSWSTWGAWNETVLDREGEPAPDGVGALRRFRRGRLTTVEEVVAFEPPSRLAYEVRAGVPVRDYHSEITLEPVGGGTRLRWVSTFNATNPAAGTMVKLVLARFLPEGARLLAAAAEADASR
jgi:uncharacterized protein YndB with AHSA1/START domain